ncbi:DNA polymerase III subunit delta' [Patescibacteria group bacterium]|nr:DNA polymerase III subunit delta' [Patescibacteria group bacterium]
MLIGHQRIWDFLTQSAAKNRLAHAYLFVGPAQIGKKTLAAEFAKWLLCQQKKNNSACGVCRSCLDIAKNQHPDLFILSPKQEEKKGVVKTFEIGIGEIKTLRRHLSLFPYSAKYKIAVIDEVGSLTREAINSFLKTLEEPGQNTLIILISSSWQFILPTIISRCQLIKFLPVKEQKLAVGLKKIGKKEGDILKIIKLAAGRPGQAINLLENPEILAGQQAGIDSFKKTLKADLAWRWDLAKELSQNLAVAQETLSQWSLWLRDRLLEASGCEHLLVGSRAETKISYPVKNLLAIIKEVQRTQDILSNSSFNSRLALEVLMMKI